MPPRRRYSMPSPFQANTVSLQKWWYGCEVITTTTTTNTTETLLIFCLIEFSSAFSAVFRFCVCLHSITVVQPQLFLFSRFAINIKHAIFRLSFVFCFGRVLPRITERCQRQHACSHLQRIFPSNRDKKFMNETRISQIEFITLRFLWVACNSCRIPCNSCRFTMSTVESFNEFYVK